MFIIQVELDLPKISVNTDVVGAVYTDSLRFKDPDSNGCDILDANVYFSASSS